MYSHVQTLSGGCGVGVLFSFVNTRDKWDDRVNLKTADFSEGEGIGGGCGFQIACFIDTKECKETYKILKDRFPIAYQSPIRHNVNSDNNFFFAVFDTGEVEGGDEGLTDNPIGFPNGLEW